MKPSDYLTAEPISKNASNLFELINDMIRIAQVEVARGAGEESLNVAYEIVKAVAQGKDKLEWMDKRAIEREQEAKEDLLGAP